MQYNWAIPEEQFRKHLTIIVDNPIKYSGGSKVTILKESIVGEGGKIPYISK